MSNRNSNNSADDFPAWQESIFCRTEAVLRWLEDTVYQVDTKVPVLDFLLSWRDGKALCALVSYHRPDLLDYASSLLLEPAQRIELALGATSSLDVPTLLRSQEWMETLNQFLLIAYFQHLYNLWYDKREVKFSGWLTKLGGKRQAKKWNYRWFTLENHSMYYYKSAAEIKHPKGAIDLHTVTAFRVIPTHTVNKILLLNEVKQVAFIQLITPQRNWLLFTQSCADHNMWIAMITNHLEKIIRVDRLDERLWNPPETISGKLYKHDPSMFSRAWRPRFFTVDHEKLHYSIKKKGDAIDFIPLRLVFDVKPSTAHENAFTVSVPGRDYLLYAQTEEEQQKWLSTISQAKEFFTEPFFALKEKAGWMYVVEEVELSNEDQDNLDLDNNNSNNNGDSDNKTTGLAFNRYWCQVAHGFLFRWQNHELRDDFNEAVKTTLLWASIQLGVARDDMLGMTLKTTIGKKVDFFVSSAGERLEWLTAIRSQIQQVEFNVNKNIWWKPDDDEEEDGDIVSIDIKDEEEDELPSGNAKPNINTTTANASKSKPERDGSDNNIELQVMAHIFAEERTSSASFVRTLPPSRSNSTDAFPNRLGSFSAQGSSGSSVNNNVSNTNNSNNNINNNSNGAGASNSNGSGSTRQPTSSTLGSTLSSSSTSPQRSTFAPSPLNPASPSPPSNSSSPSPSPPPQSTSPAVPGGVRLLPVPSGVTLRGSSGNHSSGQNSPTVARRTMLSTPSIASLNIPDGKSSSPSSSRVPSPPPNLPAQSRSPATLDKSSLPADSDATNARDRSFSKSSSDDNLSEINLEADAAQKNLNHQYDTDNDEK